MKSQSMRFLICLHFALAGALLCTIPLAWAQSAPIRPESKVVIKDFAGRTIPSIAHELINLERPADIPGIKPAALPGWLEVDTGVEGVNEFEGNPEEELFASRIWVENLNKENNRIGVVRKSYPDKSWRITEVIARTKKERLSVVCERKGHDIPPDHMLVGILNQDDPHKPPVPPRPTAKAQRKYEQDNNGRRHPRGCMADIQIARFAALLNLETGKLSLYTAKPLTCVSPFHVICKND